MSELSTSPGNGLSDHTFNLPVREEGQDTAAPQGAEGGREVGFPAAPDEQPLSASDYLDWLDRETILAQRATEEAMAGYPVRLEEFRERTMAPLPPNRNLPPFFRAFLERRIRADEEKLAGARRIAEAHAGMASSLARGKKIAAQGD